MRVHAINLDRDTDRWETFERLNGHLVDVVRFPAVDGRTLDRAELVEHGLIAEPCTRADGAIGCACSHLALWARAVDNDEPLTILEDDTMLAGNFAAAAQRVLDGLPAGWDIVMWGWNFDAHLWAEIPEGVSLCQLAFDQELMRQHIGAFRGSERTHTVVRMRHCFGTHAYTISPAGARAMLEACLPMTDAPVVFSCGDVVVDGDSIDADMNRAYPMLRSYACVPPLALSENRHETSHTRAPA